MSKSRKEFIPPGDKGWLSRNTGGGKLTFVTRGSRTNHSKPREIDVQRGGVYDREIAEECDFFGFVETFDYCYHMGCKLCNLKNLENKHTNLVRLET